MWFDIKNFVSGFGKMCIVHTSDFEHFKMYNRMHGTKSGNLWGWYKNGGSTTLESFISIYLT